MVSSVMRVPEQNHIYLHSVLLNFASHLKGFFLPLLLVRLLFQGERCDLDHLCIIEAGNPTLRVLRLKDKLININHTSRVLNRWTCGLYLAFLCCSQINVCECIGPSLLSCKWNLRVNRIFAHVVIDSH